MYSYDNLFVKESAGGINSEPKLVWIKLENEWKDKNNNKEYYIPSGVGLEGTVLGDYLK